MFYPTIEALRVTRTTLFASFCLFVAVKLGTTEYVAYDYDTYQPERRSLARFVPWIMLPAALMAFAGLRSGLYLVKLVLSVVLCLVSLFPLLEVADPASYLAVAVQPVYLGLSLPVWSAASGSWGETRSPDTSRPHSQNQPLVDDDRWGRRTLLLRSLHERQCCLMRKSMIGRLVLSGLGACVGSVVLFVIAFGYSMSCSRPSVVSNPTPVPDCGYVGWVLVVALIANVVVMLSLSVMTQRIATHALPLAVLAAIGVVGLAEGLALEFAR